MNNIETVCTNFVERCHERGIRVTPQRLAVYRVLAADKSHPTAESVHDRLKGQMHSLSLATVYRILDALEHEGLVRRVSTTDSAGRFDANVFPHQHAVCKLCGTMIDIEDARYASVGLPAALPDGFEPEELDIRIVGICGHCRGTKRNRRGK
jgi:Fur family transcriptional regulator, peroxide stress response regulator